MSKYSKKERNKIYKQVLKKFENNTDNSFICNTISDVLNHYDFVNEEEFPELFLFKDNVGLAWLSYCDKTGEYFGQSGLGKNLRKTVLDFCIEMTN